MDSKKTNESTMTEKYERVYYWCTNGYSTKYHILVVSDKPLYDQRELIEKQLPEDFSATLISLPENISIESFESTVKSLVENDEFIYSAVYFRPADHFSESEYKELYLMLKSRLPEAKWILGLRGAVKADSIALKTAKEYNLICAEADKLKEHISSCTPQGDKNNLYSSKETGLWTIYEKSSQEKELPKVLLIGDSIVWGGHKDAARALRNRADVRTFVTSLGVNSKNFSRLVGSICSTDGADYEAIYFNNGLHSHGQTPKEYIDNYKNAIKSLMKYFPKAKWILGLSTPITNDVKSGAEHETPIVEKKRRAFDEANALVLSYNEELKQYAAEENIPFLDAYSLLSDKDHWKIDCYHYNDQGKQFFGEAVAKTISEKVGL